MPQVQTLTQTSQPVNAGTRVWQPLALSVSNAAARLISLAFPAFCGKPMDGLYPLAVSCAATMKPGNIMRVQGRAETVCATLMLISLAGTGSRGHRVPLAEAANAVLLVLMAAEVYAHRVLNDGFYYVPATLGESSSAVPTVQVVEGRRVGRGDT